MTDVAALQRESWRLLPDTMARRIEGPSFTAPPHLRLISYLLYLLSMKTIARLAISLPPGHAKSSMCSHWYPVWHLDHWPSARVILSQYEATLAEEWGKAVRETIATNSELLRVQLHRDSRAADRWRTTVKPGGMWTMGAGGSITGRRAGIFLIDDPHKNFAEAHSETIRNAVWNWYVSTARTRLLPQAGICVVQTRWHEEDLIGRLLGNDRHGRWVYLRLPAIAEEDETIDTVLGDAADRLRAQGVALPDWFRAEGEPLWPEVNGERWFDLAELEETRDEVGPYIWTGLYQQRPTALEGELFKRHNWVKEDGAPSGLDLVRRWDLASSQKKSADYTAGVLMGWPKSGSDHRVYVLDVIRRRVGPAEKQRLVRDTAERDKALFGAVAIKVEQEGGSAGIDVRDDWVSRVLAGHDVEFLPSSGDKTTRAQGLAAQQGIRNVVLCRRMHPEVETDGTDPAWFEEFITEAAAFPNGKHDDMVDAASLAYSDLLARAVARRKTKVKVHGQSGRRLPVAGPGDLGGSRGPGF